MIIVRSDLGEISSNSISFNNGMDTPAPPTIPGVEALPKLCLLCSNAAFSAMKNNNWEPPALADFAVEGCSDGCVNLCKGNVHHATSFGPIMNTNQTLAACLESGVIKRRNGLPSTDTPWLGYFRVLRNRLQLFRHDNPPWAPGQEV
jgi:hypothetical protein